VRCAGYDDQVLVCDAADRHKRERAFARAAGTCGGKVGERAGRVFDTTLLVRDAAGARLHT